MKSKVFCIGFNKTGTHTFKNILRQYKIKAIHNGKWQRWAGNKDKSKFIHQGYTDGQQKDFRWLDKTFPNSKFILNTRPLENWLLSRWSHIQRNKTNKGYTGTWLNNDSKVVKYWIKERDEYHRDILTYFDNREKDFAIIDLESMTKTQIKSTFDKLFQTTVLVIPKHINIRKTNPTNINIKQKGVPIVKEALIMAGVPDKEWKSSVQTSLKHS